MKTLLSFIFIVLVVHTKAQVAEPIVLGAAPNNYMMHKVQPKENWYSVGRLYNINAKELAKYNNLVVDKGLAIAQVLKVPIVASNKFDAKVPLPIGEVSVPIYHIVEKSEGLYRIAINNGTTMEQLRQWNNLATDVLSTGTKLKVGYIRVKENESAFASTKETPIIAAVPQPKEDVPVKPKPPIKDETPPIIKEQQPKEESPAKPKPPIQDETPPVIKEVKPKEDGPKPMPKKEATPKLSKDDASEGYFKQEYVKSARVGKNMDGKAATFKTMAGWDDDKYYVLIDGLTPGSIVQVKSKLTGKMAYAKVLGEMQELKQNHGLMVRISNATANAIGENEETFDVLIVQ